MRLVFATLAFCLSTALLNSRVHAQGDPRQKEFPVGAIRALEQIPAGKLRDQIARLPAAAKQRAVAWMGNIHFTEADTHHMHADASGGIYFLDPPPEVAPADAQASGTEFEVASAAVPVSPFPANLVFHSKPGAPNVIYLNFAGETVMNTAWNDSLGRSSIPAVAFSADSDLTTFSDAEQLAIRRIWQRVAEDYASFDVDVTTERPGTFSTRIAHALITRHTDANGLDNPAASAGGVAYVGVFAASSYAQYRPAWIYCDNLSNQESYIAEAVSHEIGHNIGLTHDGKTDGSDYYGGHGSGETSWGPIMGTGYNRNVSQWSKGEYYLANNTQDDLATLASKLAFRTDDHAATFGSATPLLVSSAGEIASTTPETDPANSSTANKGRIERDSDADVFSFATGEGSVSIAVNPWIIANGSTRGGNIDLLVELHNASGQLLLQNNASDQTGALLQTNLAQGVYYLTVKPTGTGAPFSSTPSGYTSYGSVGQYFITGSVVANSIVLPPGAELAVSDVIEAGLASKTFTVAYSDDVAVGVSTIGSGDIRVTGPNGYDAIASFVFVDSSSDGSPRVATYRIDPPGTVWAETDNGSYSVAMLSDAVADTQGSYVPAGALGSFNVAVPRTIYFADFNSDPGWTLNGLWQYGLPAYLGGSAPLGGYSGLNIVGYNLSGNYENRLAAVYATTPALNCSGASTVTLQFRRWLRVRNGDTADIQISTNGTSWTDLWSNNGSVVGDTSWQLVQYSLPPAFTGSSTLQLRWGMASGQTQNDIGWNLDDVALLGNGSLDTSPPSGVLNAANLTSGGAPAHTVSVSFTDNVAVQISSFDSRDILVVGPNGTNLVEFGGVDIDTDGTPRTAFYAIQALNGTWQSTDNGEYNVYLQAGEVADTSGNAIEAVWLGTFTVAIPTVQQALLVEPVQVSVTEGSEQSFSVRLAAQPSANVIVWVTGPSGDPDLIITSGATNVFTSETWNVPAIITLAAADDADQANGSATFLCQSDGLASVTVTATEQDITPTPPVVTLIAPTPESHFLSTASISFAAEASDDGAIAKVEFFAEAILVGTDSTGPYEITSSLAPGIYSITAKATDNVGATAFSAAVSITVSAPNEPPSIAITSPAADATFVFTEIIMISANATDDDTVASVEFFSNGDLIGTDSSAPYSISVSLPAGTHSLTAKATDNDGASTTSSTVVIAVSAPNEAPTVAITSPAADATFVSTEIIMISASATDDDTVASVEFFSNGDLIGTDSSAPYSVSVSLPAGTHSLTAKATDNDGASTTSSTVVLTVSVPNEPPTVVITSPAADATFVSTEIIMISASATDDDTVTVVELFSNGDLIGTDSTAPYSVSVSLPVGTHSLTAKATDNDGASTTSSTVTVSVFAPNEPPTIAITSPASDATFVSTEIIMISASATDDDTVASVEFFSNGDLIGTDSTAPYSISVSLPVGTHSLTAKATDNDGASTISLSVTITVSAPNEPPTVVITSPASDATFVSTEIIMISANATDDDTITSVEFFSNGDLIGTDSTAPYSVSVSLPVGTHSLTAKATDNDGVSTTSSTVTVTVSAPNEPPTVAITSPAADATFVSTEIIMISASATDDDTITSVEFFSNGDLIGTDSTAPYSVSVSLPVGTHSLTAKATDNDGVSTTSSTVTVTVSAPNEPPTVAITSPAADATFVSTEIIMISASATDDDTITSVEFFSNGDLIGTDSTAPYSISFSLPVGTHSLTAKATDNDGASTTSSTVVINVSAPNEPPTVAITSPAADATFVSTEIIMISASATDDDTITSVDFFSNGDLIGTDSSAPYSVSVSLPVGTHSLTAKATDNDGASTISSTVTITISTPNQPPNIAILSPTQGFTVSSDQTIDFNIEASDDGEILSVQIFLNEELLSQFPTSPYQHSTNLPAGTYQLTAVATDDQGLVSSSEPVDIQITAAYVQPPEVVSISAEGGIIRLLANTNSAASYTLEASSDLSLWVPVATNTAVSGTLSFEYSASGSHEFYRVGIAK